MFIPSHSLPSQATEGKWTLVSPENYVHSKISIGEVLVLSGDGRGGVEGGTSEASVVSLYDTTWTIW